MEAKDFDIIKSGDIIPCTELLKKFVEKVRHLISVTTKRRR